MCRFFVLRTWHVQAHTLQGVQVGVGGLCKGDSHPAPWLSDPTLTCFLPRADELGEGF